MLKQWYPYSLQGFTIKGSTALQVVQECKICRSTPLFPSKMMKYVLKIWIQSISLRNFGKVTKEPCCPCWLFLSLISILLLSSPLYRRPCFCQFRSPALARPSWWIRIRQSCRLRDRGTSQLTSTSDQLLHRWQHLHALRANVRLMT